MRPLRGGTVRYRSHSMLAILGISAFYHDSAAALVVDGRIVAASQEERFTRRKFDDGCPRRAIEYCLRAGETRLHDLDYVVFYDKPFLKFERLVETYLAYAIRGKAARRIGQIGFHQPLELEKRLIVEHHVIEIVQARLACAQAILDRAARAAVIELSAGEALFLRRGHDPAVHDQCRGTVVIK